MVLKCDFQDLLDEALNVHLKIRGSIGRRIMGVYKMVNDLAADFEQLSETVHLLNSRLQAVEEKVIAPKKSPLVTAMTEGNASKSRRVYISATPSQGCSDCVEKSCNDHSFS